MEDQKDSPKRSLKALITTMLMVVFLLLGAALFLPKWAESPFGKSWLTKILSQKLGGSVTFESGSLSWFSEQSFKNFSYEAYDHSVSSHIKEITTSASLWSLLFQKKGDALLVILEPTVTHKSTKNLSDESPHQEQDRKSSLVKIAGLDLFSKIDVIKGSSTYEIGEEAPIYFKEVGLTLIKNDEGLSLVKVNGSINQENLSGNFFYELKLQDILFSDLDNIFEDVSRILTLDKKSEIYNKLHMQGVPSKAIELIIAHYKNKAPPIEAILGKDIDADIGFFAHNKEISLDINIDTEQTKAKLFGSLRDGAFSLNVPATLEQKMTSNGLSLFKLNFGDLSHYQHDDLVISGRIDTLSVPVAYFVPDYSKISITGYLQVPHLSLVNLDKDVVIILDDLFLSLKTPLTSNYKVEGSTAITYGGSTSQISLKGSLEKPLTDEGVINQQSLRWNSLLSITNFPLILLQKKLDLPLIIDTLGSSFSGSISTNYYQGKTTHSVKGETPYLMIQDLNLSKTEVLSATQTSTLIYTPSPYWMSVCQTRKGLQPQEIAPLTISLERLLIHLPSLQKGVWDPTKHSIEFSVKSKEIKALWPQLLRKHELPLYFHKISFYLKAPSFDQISFSLQTTSSQKDEESDLYHLIGPQADINVQAILDFKKNDNISLRDLLVSLNSSKLNIQIPKAEISKQTLSFHSPAIIDYDLHPELLHYLKLDMPYWPKLANDPHLHLEISHLKVPTNRERLSELSCLIEGNVDLVAVRDCRDNPPFFLQNFNISIEKDANSHYQGSLWSSISKQEQQKDGDIRIELDGFQMIEKNKPWSGWIKGYGKNIPVKAFEAIFNKDKSLTTLLGEQLQFEGKLSRNLDKIVNVEGSINTEQASASLNFTVDQTTLRSSKDLKPNTLYWTVNENALSGFMHYLTNKDVLPFSEVPRTQFVIPAALTMNLTSYELPLEDITNPSYFEAQIASSPILLVNNLDQRRLRFSQMKGNFIMTPSQLTFTLNSKLEKALVPGIYQALDEKNPLPFSLNVVLTKESGPWSQPNIQEGKVNFDAALFPTLPFWRYLPKTKEELHLLHVTVPPFMEMHLQAQKEKESATLLFQMQDKELFVDGGVTTREGSLYLTKPFNLKWLPSDTTKDELAQHMRAPWMHTISVESPLSVQIRKESFVMPYLEQDPLLKTFLYADIDLGKFKTEQGSQIAQLLALCKVPKAEGRHMIWFAPTHCEVQNGVLEIPRFDLLVDDKFEFLGFGKAQLDTLKLNAGFAFPPSTLHQLFHLDYLKENTLLVIPLRGSLLSPQLNIELAAARIASLYAMQTESFLGDFLGSLLVESPRDLPPRPEKLPWDLSH